MKNYFRIKFYFLIYKKLIIYNKRDEILNTIFDAIQCPHEFGRISVFEKKFQQKNLCKNYAFELTVKRSSYFCLFFLFKYDEVIIKQSTSCTFGIKVVKI